MFSGKWFNSVLTHKIMPEQKQFENTPWSNETPVGWSTVVWRGKIAITYGMDRMTDRGVDTGITYVIQ